MHIKKRTFPVVSFLSLLLVAPAVNALERQMDPMEMFGNLAEIIRKVLQDPDAVYGITIFFSFILFFVLWGAPLKRMRIFEGEGGLGLNQFGKMFATGAAGLTCLAVFAFRENVVSAAKMVFQPFGYLGILLLGFLAFVFIWRELRDTTLLGFGNTFWALLAALAVMWIGGALLGYGQTWTFLLAISIIIIGIAILLKIGYFAFGRRGVVTPRQVENAERTEARDEAQERRVLNSENHRDPDLREESEEIRRLRFERDLLKQLLINSRTEMG